MAKKTINQALKDLFLGLGGDPSKLSDNTSVSDYIEDLESAIEAAATAELPTPAETNVGKVATVVSDGEDGYEWSAEAIPQELPTPAVGDIGKVVSVVSDGESGAEYDLESFTKLPTLTLNDDGKYLSAYANEYVQGYQLKELFNSMQATLNGTTISISTAEDFKNIFSKFTGAPFSYLLITEVDPGSPQKISNSRLYFRAYQRISQGPSDPTYILVFEGMRIKLDGTVVRCEAVFNNSKTGTYSETAIS